MFTIKSRWEQGRYTRLLRYRSDSSSRVSSILSLAHNRSDILMPSSKSCSFRERDRPNKLNSSRDIRCPRLALTSMPHCRILFQPFLIQLMSSGTWVTDTWGSSLMCRVWIAFRPVHPCTPNHNVSDSQWSTLESNSIRIPGMLYLYWCADPLIGAIPNNSTCRYRHYSTLFSNTAGLMSETTRLAVKLHMH